MKFSYNYNKMAMNGVLNLSFSAPSDADANLIKMLAYHCNSQLTREHSLEGAQCCVLLKVFYDHIVDSVCRNLERISNRVFNWSCNLMNGEFVISIQFGNNKTLIKKIAGLVMKNIQLHKLWPAYAELCRSIKCTANADEFKHLASVLGKSISNGHMYVSAKVNINNKDFQDIMKEQSKKLSIQDLKGKAAKYEKLDTSHLRLTDNTIKVNNAYAAIIMDHLHSRKVNCKWIGEEIYICSNKSINRHFADNILTARIKKYMKLKDHFKSALTHDMLASGIPPSLIKSVSSAEMKQVMSKYK